LLFIVIFQLPSLHFAMNSKTSKAHINFSNKCKLLSRNTSFFFILNIMPITFIFSSTCHHFINT
jgi:hypothetical protein